MTDDQPAKNSVADLYAIIVAGGSGSRMKSDIPKQFLLLRGKPILQHTLERFLEVVRPSHIRLVLPASDRTTWLTLCEQYQFFPAIELVDGGKTRFQSVRNGLKALPLTNGLVAVHDGVRPFVSAEIIRNSFDTAARTGSAVTCVPVKDSIRVMHPDGQSQSVDRNQYRLVQTPQTFQLDLFRQAFEATEQSFFTDCASVMEFAGFSITLIDGSYENIKITTPDDLR